MLRKRTPTSNHNARLCTALIIALVTSTTVFAQTALPKTDAAKADAQRPAIPNEPTVTTATYGSWVLRCIQIPPQPASADGKSARPSAQTCEVAQTVQVQGQPQPIAQVAIGHLPGDKDLTLTAVLPVNISLPGQVRLSGNGKTGTEEKGALTLAWQRCIAGACIAAAQPDAATLAVIRTGTEGHIRFVDATGNIFSIPLSWTGLDQAITALDKQK